MSAIKLYDLAPSPNNMKARIALGFKGLPYEKVPVDSQDRATVIKVSGQPRTPVLVHGTVVIFDSSAILRYLEANFPETPRLFSSDYATMSGIDAWESWARSVVEEPVAITFRQLFGTKDSDEFARANVLLNEATAKIEARLAASDWLVGDQMTAADVVAAPSVAYGLAHEGVVGHSPIATLFAERLRLGSGRDKTRAWARRVVAWDK
jgi:glutathione S-transferase